MRASAEPQIGFFDIGSKHYAVSLRGQVIDAPSVVYVPWQFHYRSGFDLYATGGSPAPAFDKDRSLLVWWPDKQRETNQLVIAPIDALNTDALPDWSQADFGQTAHLLRWTGDDDPPVVVSVPVHEDPQGPDLPVEYALIENRGVNDIDLAGWTLSDAAGHVFRFSDRVLAAREELRVWVKAGTDTEHDVYWGRRAPIWNNRGDTAVLRDRTGREIARGWYTA